MAETGTRTAPAVALGLVVLAVILALFFLPGEGDQRTSTSPGVPGVVAEAAAPAPEPKAPAGTREEPEPVRDTTRSDLEQGITGWSTTPSKQPEGPPTPRGVKGRVVRGDRPVEGARVRLFAKQDSLPLDGRADDDPGMAETLSDADGEFSFLEVPDGADYALRADHAGDHVELNHFDVNRASFPPPVVLRFGSALVRGQVFDGEGAPLSGIPVRSILLGHVKEGGSSAQYARTDGSGAFEFGGLLPGRRYVTITPPGPYDSKNQRLLLLGPTDEARIVFGEPYPYGELNAQLRDGNGQELPGVRDLFLLDVGTLDERRIHTDESGRFACELPAGTWEVFEAAGLFRRARLGSFVMPPADATVDVNLESICLKVHVVSSRGTPAAKTDRAALRSLVLSRPGSAEERASESTNAPLTWIGLEPGRYEIRAKTNDRLVPDAPRVIEVGSDQRVVVLELLLDV